MTPSDHAVAAAIEGTTTVATLALAQGLCNSFGLSLAGGLVRGWIYIRNLETVFRLNTGGGAAKYGEMGSAARIWGGPYTGFRIRIWQGP